MSIYSEIILDHYQSPKNFGRVKNYTHLVQVANPLCGDRLEMTAKLKDNKIVDIKFQGVGCAISIASASMLTSFVLKKDLSLLKKIDKNFIIKMLKVDLGVNRVKCALLPLEALKKLFINEK